MFFFWLFCMDFETFDYWCISTNTLTWSIYLSKRCSQIFRTLFPIWYTFNLSNKDLTWFYKIQVRNYPSIVWFMTHIDFWNFHSTILFNEILPSTSSPFLQLIAPTIMKNLYSAIFFFHLKYNIWFHSHFCLAQTFRKSQRISLTASCWLTLMSYLSSTFLSSWTTSHFFLFRRNIITTAWY